MWRGLSSQKPACGFPAQASSVMDSQNCQGFHPAIRNIQPWASQREAPFDLLELLPCDLTSLASGTEHSTPTSLAGAMQAVKRSEVPTHTEVGVVPLQYLVDLRRLLRQAAMANDRHHLGQPRKTTCHPSLLGLSTDLEISGSVACAVMGEAQEVDGLQLAPMPFAVARGKAPELNQLGFARL